LILLLRVFPIANELETKGIEHSPLTAPKTPISEVSRAKCGALDDKNDPDLAALVKVWPGLPGHIKAAIKALVQTHETTKEQKL